MESNRGQNVGCLGRLLQLLSGGASGGEAKGELGEPPFLAKDWLRLKAERSFLGVLDQAVAAVPPR